MEGNSKIGETNQESKPLPLVIANFVLSVTSNSYKSLQNFLGPLLSAHISSFVLLFPAGIPYDIPFINTSHPFGWALLKCPSSIILTSWSILISTVPYKVTGSPEQASPPS